MRSARVLAKSNVWRLIPAGPGDGKQSVCDGLSTRQAVAVQKLVIDGGNRNGYRKSDVNTAFPCSFPDKPESLATDRAIET
jgi:6-phosphogluconate dehydrogenase (decarboxylating)